jgi:hypothetical protein
MSHHRRGRAVNSQMPQTKVPSTAGARGTINQYDRAPFSAHPRDTGNGGIPLKIFESHGEKLPKDHPPGQTAPPRGTGTPPLGKRRFS